MLSNLPRNPQGSELEPQAAGSQVPTFTTAYVCCFSDIYLTSQLRPMRRKHLFFSWTPVTRRQSPKIRASSVPLRTKHWLSPLSWWRLPSRGAGKQVGNECEVLGLWECGPPALKGGKRFWSPSQRRCFGSACISLSPLVSSSLTALRLGRVGTAAVSHWCALVQGTGLGSGSREPRRLPTLFPSVKRGRTWSCGKGRGNSRCSYLGLAPRGGKIMSVCHMMDVGGFYVPSTHTTHLAGIP